MNKLVPFNNHWNLMFEKEKEHLLNLLKDQKVETIEHIGATSVNQCSTFGTIDIMISLQSYLDLVTIKNILIRKGYEYVKHFSDDLNCVYLVGRNKNKQIVSTVRIVEYASIIYQQLLLFK